MVYGPQPAKQAAAKAYNLYNLAVFTIGAKAANTINVAVQLQDARGRNIAQIANVQAYLSASPTGAGLSAVPTSSALAIGTNGTILAITVAGLVVDLITNASGQFDLNIIQTAGGTPYYLVLCLPDGSVICSPIIQF
jgi:hypothetical protein